MITPIAQSWRAQVPMEQRINRATSAVFRFQDGAIGSLSHTALLHESRYHTALEIVCDGLHILVEDPYGNAQVTVRKPHSETYEKVRDSCSSQNLGNSHEPSSTLTPCR